MARGTSVVVIDQQEIFRTGLGAILDALEGVTVAGLGGTSEDALRLARSKQPQVVLLDSALEAGEPGTLVRSIRAASPRSAVIMLAADPPPSEVLATVSAGACGYVLKSAPRNELASAIVRALRGETFVDPLLAGRMVQAFAETAAAGPAERRPEPLTPREREVLGEISRGRSNKEIASDLQIASGTIKVHVERILRKLSAANRVEAATIGLHQGLIPGDAPADAASGDAHAPRA